MKTKNIRIKKKGGGSRLQRVQVLASGKYKFIKNPKSKSRSKVTKTSRKTKKGGKDSMAKKKRGRRRQFTIPIAPLVGIAPMVAPAIKAAIDTQDPMAVVDALAWNTLGVADIPSGKPRFDAGKMVSNLIPLAAGILVHKFVGGPPLNLNKTLASAGVPFIRI